MNINRIFDYPKIERVTHEDGTRFYTCPATQAPLASITTILSATADKTSLLLWEEFVGKKKADRVREEALALGTLMHTHVENHIEGVERPRGNHPMRMQAARMADQIIDNYLPDVNEVWGMEVGLYYPGLFAGTTDLVGVYKGKPAIMDHKSAKKVRSWDEILDYRDQTAAYALAHNHVYGTDIKTGVVFMVDRQLKSKAFFIDEDEMEARQCSFLQRFETYLTNVAGSLQSASA